MQLRVHQLLVSSQFNDYAVQLLSNKTLQFEDTNVNKVLNTIFFKNSTSYTNVTTLKNIIQQAKKNVRPTKYVKAKGLQPFLTKYTNLVCKDFFSNATKGIFF